MLLYTSEYLQIKLEKEDDILVQYWIKSPVSIEEFKKEMLSYVIIYEKYKPSKSLWLQENFKINLDVNLSNWIEENVNIPCFNFVGLNSINNKLAFVVSKDVLVHITTINVFEKESVFKEQTKHFSSEKKAREWLMSAQDICFENKTKILFDGEDNEGNIVLKINSNTDIKKAFLALEDIKVQEQLNTNKLLLKNGTVLNIEEILYIKSDGHYVEVFMENVNRPIMERNTLKDLLKVLPSANFIRTHKSYIVNMHKIKIINATQLKLQNGDWINLSRTYKQGLKDLFNKE